MAEPSNQQPKRGFIVTVLVLGLSVVLAACTTSADVTYGEYSFGPGYEAGRVYENRIYADTDRGLGRERCRTVVEQTMDAFGRRSAQEEVICD